MRVHCQQNWRKGTGSSYQRGKKPERWYSTTSATSATATATSKIQTTGLFSIPELQSPSDFGVLTQRAIRQGNQLRSAVAATVAVNSRQDAVVLLHQLDDISKTVCNVIDAAELCRNVHADAHWREAASHAFTVLSDYISLLNADTSLYQALCLVRSSPHYLNDELSEEERRFTKLLQAEFERDGIHLPHTQRETVRHLQNNIVELESSFSYNLVHSRKVFMANAVAVTNVIPRHVLRQYGIDCDIQDNEASFSSSQSAPVVQLADTDASVLQTLLRYSPDPAIRRDVHWHVVTAVPENLTVLAALVQARHALATTQGFASYVERNVVDKMTTSAAAIGTFLQDAAANNKAAFGKEMSLLSKAKQQVEGNATLEPWDTAYYTALLSARHGDALSELSQYFTVAHTLASMQLLVERLFGIVMRQEPMTGIEQWDLVVSPGSTEQNSTVQAATTTKTSTLRKYTFSFEDEPLGIMYLDLHPRADKYGHAAHFTVRCGCAIHYDTEQHDSTLAGDYQCPIVALVCNVSSRETIAHSEVETLFHEFGHALHSLLSRTKFQHMSGTRAALDFVETPSHLLEHFVWDRQFLQVLGRHATTGQPIPDAMIDALRSSRYAFAALERHTQILHSTFDQELFGVPGPSGTTIETTQALFAQLHSRYGIPFAHGSHWYSRFGHLVSYGAGYYGYLYAQGFARSIWEQCLEHDCMNRSAGTRVWRTLLVHGGARDPHLMLSDLLGRLP
jgi:mitochondrial intermediate peptidase